MMRASQVLTVLSVLTALASLSWWAVAATCAGSLPPTNALAGWVTVPSSTLSGAMGGEASYRAYDGAVEAMKAQGIRSFAQRVYRHSTSGRYLTLDVYQLRDVAAAQALYAKKQKGYNQAKPLTNDSSIKDAAFIGTLGGMTFGVLRCGSFVAEANIAKAATPQDRVTVKRFLRYVSQKLSR